MIVTSIFCLKKCHYIQKNSVKLIKVLLFYLPCKKVENLKSLHKLKIFYLPREKNKRHHIEFPVIFSAHQLYTNTSGYSVSSNPIEINNVPLPAAMEGHDRRLSGLEYFDAYVTDTYQFQI